MFSRITQLHGTLSRLSKYSEVDKHLEEVLRMAREKGVRSGFIIGNTVKAAGRRSFYKMPIRDVGSMVVSGVVVYKEKEAIEIVQQIDGHVEYILVDAEKKIPHSHSDFGGVPNIERRVRERLKLSKLWVYKGNDVTVDAADALISHLYKDHLTGIGGRKVAIIGAGNIGVKLALKLVERGAGVTLCRRNLEVLEKIVDALNLIKPPNTIAKVIGVTDKKKAAYGADILVGATNGTPVITRNMLKSLNDTPIVIDVGKGTLTVDAINFSRESNVCIYRLDVTAALCGLIKTLTMTEEIVQKRMGRRRIGDYVLVSGGLLANEGDVIVDNVTSPKHVLGIADGAGDFCQQVSPDTIKTIKQTLALNGDFIE